MQFVNLKKLKQIKDIGNYNICITVPENYNYIDKLIETIYKILSFNGVVSTSYYEMKPADLRPMKLNKFSKEVQKNEKMIMKELGQKKYQMKQIWQERKSLLPEYRSKFMVQNMELLKNMLVNYQRS